jgi:hypothetical protein
VLEARWHFLGQAFARTQLQDFRAEQDAKATAPWDGQPPIFDEALGIWKLADEQPPNLDEAWARWREFLNKGRSTPVD